MRRRALATAVTAAVVAVAFLWVLPRVADLGTVWRLIRTLPAAPLVALAALTLANLATYPLLSMASLPGLRFWPAMVVTQASTAVANTVPAGGGVGVGVTYAMYGRYGFPSTAVTLSVTTTGVANAAVKFAMPLVAAALLAAVGDAPGWAWRAAWAGALLVALTALLGWRTVRRDSAPGLVMAGARGVARLRRRDPEAAARAAERGLAALRREARALLRPRGLPILGLAVLSHLALYALFAACLAAVGAGVPLAVSFAVFAVVRLGLVVPVTPGSVGWPRRATPPRSSPRACWPTRRWRRCCCSAARRTSCPSRWASRCWPSGAARGDERPCRGCPRRGSLRGMTTYATPTGAPCPRTVRADGTVDGDGGCHSCGLGAACPLYDPWDRPEVDADAR